MIQFHTCRSTSVLRRLWQPKRNKRLEKKKRTIASCRRHVVKRKEKEEGKATSSFNVSRSPSFVPLFSCLFPSNKIGSFLGHLFWRASYGMLDDIIYFYFSFPAPQSTMYPCINSFSTSISTRFFFSFFLLSIVLSVPLFQKIKRKKKKNSNRAAQ